MLSAAHFNPETKIWCGASEPNNLDETKTLGDIILEALDIEPNKIAQISDNNEVHLTKADIKLKSLKIGKGLQKMGLLPHEIIGVIARNTENLTPLIIAAILNGIPVNTLDPTFGICEIVHMFGLTKPSVVFCDDANYEDVKKSLNKLNLNPPIYTVRGKIPNIISVEEILRDADDEEVSAFVPIRIKDTTKHIAMILCSSGTTGLSKGVCLSHAQLKYSTGMLFLRRNMNSILSFSSLYWLSGVVTILLAISGGMVRVITDEPFSAELMLRMIEKYKIEMLITAPSQMAMVLNCVDIKSRDLSSVKLFLSGGSMVSPTLSDEMAKYIPNGVVGTGYGLTEVSTGCTSTLIQNKRGSVGKLISNVQVKIYDENGKALGINEDGEIFINSPLKFLGYYGQPDKTKEILDEEGWIHSGDIGHIDEEGFLFLVDRKKDILKCNNYQYSPSEIEQEIRSAFDIAEICVCGIPGPLMSDLPAAMIVQKLGSTITEQLIIDHVARNMSDHKQLRGGVYFVDEIPKTASGKYIRSKVREIASKMSSERNMNDKNLN